METVFRRALELPGQGDNPYLRLSWADLLLERGDLEEARRLLHQAREVSPYSLPILVSLAQLERLRGRVEEAERLLKEAEARDPLNPYVRHVQGELALARGDLDRAEELFSSIVRELDPTNVAAWTSLGRVAALRGDEDEARRRFRRAFSRAERREAADRLKTLHAWAAFEQEHGDREEAGRLYQKALALDGENAYTLEAYARWLRSTRPRPLGSETDPEEEARRLREAPLPQEQEPSP